MNRRRFSATGPEISISGPILDQGPANHGETRALPSTNAQSAPNHRAAAIHREKDRVALSSVIAAIGLTLAKLVAGLLTGSLGLIAEAVHSGIDLVAALTTLFAVRLAAKPPDREHPYGHARIESISALFEASLLIGAALWIIEEAYRRLVGSPTSVNPSVWAFLVMGGSILVDFSRSRALGRIAQKHRSEALAADALHFRTDIYSSAVVILGLAGVWLGERIGQATLLAQADALAALVVALFVVFAGGRMAWATVDALIDRSPEDLSQSIDSAITRIPGVMECRRVRLRRAGGILFADIVIGVPRAASFAESHRITEQIETAIRALAPASDVVVHVEPSVPAAEPVADQVYFLARQLGARAHDVRVRRVGKEIEADLHLEVNPELPLDRAHAVASELEARLTAENPRIRRVSTHLEAPESAELPRRELTAHRADLIERIRTITEAVPQVTDCHEIHLYQARGADSPVDALLHCTVPASLTVGEAHALSAEIEYQIRQQIPGFGSILIHTEPRP